MKKYEWPGIATAAALICTGTIVFAIWRDPDGFKLKDWQTLMAACIALAGGTLAYRGAMAKVTLDKETTQFALDRERLSLFLKLRMAITIFCNEVRQQRMWAEPPFTDSTRPGSAIGPERIVQAKTLVIDLPTEFDEAWAKLDLLDESTIMAMANLRSTTRTVRIAIETLGIEKEWTYSRLQTPEEVMGLILILSEIEMYCARIAQNMDRAISKRAVH